MIVPFGVTSCPLIVCSADSELHLTILTSVPDRAINAAAPSLAFRNELNIE